MTPRDVGSVEQAPDRHVPIDDAAAQRAELRFQARYEVTRLLAVGGDLDAILVPILQAIARAEDWSYGAYWRVDERADELVCAATWCRPHGPLERLCNASRAVRLKPGEGMPGHVWASGAPFLVDDVADFTHPSRSAAALDAELQGGLVLPVLGQTAVVGVLEFMSTEPPREDPDLLTMLTLLASQLGVFVERVAAQGRRAQTERRMALLADASAVLLGTLEVSAVIPVVLDLSRRLLEADAYALWRPEADQEWRIACADGLSREYIEASPGRSRLDDTAASLVVEDVRTDPLVAARRALYDAEGIRAMLVLPLRIGGAMAGSLVFYYREPRRFPEEELRAAATLANIAAAAISNAQSHEAQARLRAVAEEAQQRWRQIVDSVEAVVWEAAPGSGALTFVSQRAELLLGYPLEHWTRTRDARLQLIHAPDRDRYQAALDDVLRDGRNADLEYRMRASDGHLVWVRDMVRGVFDEAGGLTRVLGVIVDITRHKQVESELQQRMDQLKSLYALSLDVARASGVDEILQVTMAAVRQALHADRAAVMLLSDDGRMHMRASLNLSESYRSGIEGHSPWATSSGHAPLMIHDVGVDLGLPWRRVFEEEGIRSVAFIPLLYEDRLVGKLTLCYDAPRRLTDDELHQAFVSATHLAFALERRRAEMALRESEQRYHRTFDDAPVGIAHTRFDGAILRVNRRLCDILGYTADELLARRWQDLLVPEDFAAEAAAVPQMISGAIDRYTREKRFRRRDGRTLWMLLSTSVLGDVGGAGRYFVTTIQDVSERKRFEEALRASEEQLRAALEEGQMVLLDWKLVPVDRPPGRSSHDWAVWFGPVPDVMDEVHPDDRPYVIRTVTEAAYGTGEFRGEFRLRRQGADALSWSEVRGRIQRGAKGLPARLSGLHMDITERKTAEFHRIARQQLTDTLGSALTLEEAGPAVLRVLGHNLDWAYGELWTVAGRGRVLRRAAWWADRPGEFRALTEESARWHFHRGEGMAGAIWETGSSVWMETASSSRYPRLLLANALGLRGLYAFPVMLGGKVICVVTLFSRQARPRDEAVVSTLAGLGSQLGQFLERRRAESELREETRIVETLQRIGATLTAELELERVVQAVADDVTSLVGARAGIFYYHQTHDEGTVTRVTFSGLLQRTSDATVGALERLLDDPRARGGDVLTIDDLESDPRAVEALEEAEMAGIRSVLAVPVVARTGEHVGGWFFAHGDAEMFGEREARIAAGIAAWSAAAVENASLYDLTRRAEEHARAQLEFTRTITGSLGESVFAMDREGRLIFANPAFEDQFGWTEDELRGEDVEGRLGSPGLLARVVDEGRTVRVEDLFLKRRDDSTLAAACTVSPILERGVIRGACVAVGDVTEQRRARALMEAEKRMLGRIAVGAPLEQVLDDLVSVVEEQSAGLRAALLLASADGSVLEYAVAPSLPLEMRQTLGRQLVAQNLTPSAAAADGRQDVVVPDIASSGAQWAAFRELALRHGLRATVATPVVGTDGRLLGVLSGYYTSVRIPPTEDIELLGMAAHVARIAIDRQRADEERLDLLQREQRARQETEGARRRLANILGSITDAFVSVDRDWHYTYVNERYATMVGQPDTSAMLGRRLWDDFAHARETDFFFEMQYALREQVTVNFEVRSDDLGRWLDVRAYPLQDGLAVYFQDISGRKALEDARDALYLQLEGERGRLEAVVQQMPAAVIISDADGRVAMTNQLVTTILGPPRSGDEGYGDSLRRLHDEEFAPGEAPMQRALRGEVVAGQEVLFVRADQHRMVLRMSAAPLRDPFGRITGSVVAFYDISEQKRAEEGERLLARASAALGSSLDYERTLESLAWMAVPQMADWCAVDVADETTGELRRLAVAHVDPDKIAFVSELDRLYPADPQVARGVHDVMRTGLTAFWPDIPNELLVEVSRDEEHLRLLRLLGLRSAILAPLKARGRTLGVLTFVTAESGRLYDDKDVRLAEDLAQRAAFAFDNARLHRQTTLREQRARFLADLSRDLSGSLERERPLDSVVRALVENGSEWCVIDLVSPQGQTLDVVMAHRDPDREAVMRELRGRFTVPYDLTPASRAIREKRSVLVSRVRDAQLGPAHLEVVERVGAESMIASPLLARGSVLGALTVASLTPGRYGEEDREFVEEIANRIALALDNGRLFRAEQAARAELDVLYARERDIVKTLGKSFLGVPPRQSPGLDLAGEHRFALEANRVGGDYYDFVTLDEHRLAVVVGDVCGKGIQASVFTATTKYMLRAYAFEDASPATVLARLNRALYREMSDNGMFVTLIYAVLDTEAGTVTWANAGHPPPVLYDGEQRACVRLDATGSLLGGIPDVRYGERVLPFAQGSVLALFTDGVSEASGELDPLGDGGVCDILQACAADLDARGIADRILRHAIESAGDQPRDDLAIVVARRQASLT